MSPTLRHRNGKLYLDNSSLATDVLQYSFLSETGSIGDAQIFLQSYGTFADNQVLLIEDLGTESAEIVSINGTPSVAGGAVLDSVLVRSHPVGSRVYILDFNQIELSHATTATGSKTVLTINSGIVSVQPDTKIQIYNEAEFSSGFYFARYKHSISGVFSGYTDALEFGGWDSNTVGHIVERALRDTGRILSDKITVDDCFAWLNDGLDEIKGKLKRWPEHFTDNAILGQTTRGIKVVSMPSDIYDTETNKSIVGLRVGTGKNLIYKDPSEFDALMEGVSLTQVRTQASATDTTLAIDNSYDFEDSGTVNVYISGTKYSITYTGVTRSASAGILTGVPASGEGSISVTIPVDTNVWQNEVEGIPTYFTVRNGQIEFWSLADSTQDNQNIYADYNTVATAVNSQGDTIDFQRFKMLQYYLSWRIDMKAGNNGKLDTEDGWHKKYKEALNDAIRTLAPSRRAPWSPKINKMSKRGPIAADLQKLSVDEQ